MVRKNLNVILLLVIPSLIGILFNFIRNDGLDLLRKEKSVNWVDDNELTSLFENDSLKTVKSLTTNQVYDLYNLNMIIMVDARDEWDYKDGHIKNAVNIPAYDFDLNLEKLNSLKKEDKIVVYCGDDNCDLSKELASKFLELNYKYVFVYQGGWFEWLEHGYPITIGESD